MRRLAFLGLWLVATLLAAWVPQVNDIVTSADSTPGTLPMPAAPTPAPTVTAPATPQPATAVASVSGIASWYAYTAGEAAAGPSLRATLGSGWRGSTVEVCSEVCVVVALTDWCQCYGTRVIDLDRRDFARLANPSRGLVSVEIKTTLDKPLARRYRTHIAP